MISEDTLDKVRELPIETVVGQYVKLAKDGRTSMKGLCPFHSENTPSFSINLNKNLNHCFGCNRGGDGISFIMEKENLTAAGVSDLLNKKSGVKGIFGVSSDMRELEAAVAAGNNKMADLTENMYFYRIKKYIGAYAAALGGVDIIVFTGGVGENQASCRSGACEGLEYMGVKLDMEKNKVRGEEVVISADDSKVKVVVIPTDEELMIASDTMAILNKK